MKPLNGTITTTSKYGIRKHPVTGKITFHYGVDLVSKEKDIIATSDGKVIKVVNKGSKGGTMCLVRLQHKDYQSAYYHNKSGSAIVKVGDYVKKGDKLAIMGNTGICSGTHLHFQIDKGTNKTAINPKDYASGKKELAGLDNKQHYSGEYPTIPLRGYFKMGDKGTEVKKLQQLLNWCNDAKITCDGVYGKQTNTQVGKFQTNNKLTIDYKFGKKCLATAKMITK